MHRHRLAIAVLVFPVVFGSPLLAAEPSVARITLLITPARVTVANSDKEAETLHDEGTHSGGGVLVICRELNITRPYGAMSQLTCIDAEFMTASGMRGSTKQLRYDTAQKKVTLTGNAGIILLSGGNREPETELPADTIFFQFGRKSYPVVPVIIIPIGTTTNTTPPDCRPAN